LVSLIGFSLETLLRFGVKKTTVVDFFSTKTGDIRNGQSNEEGVAQ